MVLRYDKYTKRNLQVVNTIVHSTTEEWSHKTLPLPVVENDKTKESKFSLLGWLVLGRTHVPKPNICMNISNDTLALNKRKEGQDKSMYTYRNI